MAGFAVTWLVECKYWKTPVSKLHVLALREIVADLGADRGIILCEVGFQAGAIEAANLTNVQVSSLANLSSTSRDAVYAARLPDLFDRTEACRIRYWDIPKDIRIEKGLRFDIGDQWPLYSGATVVDYCADLLARALRGQFPLSADQGYLMRMVGVGRAEFENAEQVAEEVERHIADLERRIEAAGYQVR